MIEKMTIELFKMDKKNVNYFLTYNFEKLEINNERVKL